MPTRKMALTLVLFTAICAALPAANAAPKGIEVRVDKDDIDLVNRVVHFTLNRAADSASLQVFGEKGELLGEQVEIYNGAKAGTELAISWPELPPGTENFRVDLKFTDVNEYWVGLTICRFSGVVPHEEVVFESGKWEIRTGEAPKLDVAIPKIIEMLERSKACSENDRALYVAGHTDRVGSNADNLELSRQRANAIAKYLLANGLGDQKIQVYVRGFGEEVLAVDTADNVGEERNRRADYIVSNFQPEIAGPGSWVRIK
jgi:outer membrane protein OmpA-like peptidoglycan-associated protein